MNIKQKMFHDFFLKMVKEGKEQEAEALLAESFRRQEAGSFDAAYLAAQGPKFFALIKPECVDQLKEAMSHFKSQL